MRILFTGILLATLSGCSMSMLYPAAGAVAGGATGALVGGPTGAGLGAGIGYSGGKVAQLTATNKELTKALTEGDVSDLVNKGLKDAKDGGYFDSILDEVYNVIVLCCIGLIAWNVVPLVWTYLLKREVRKNGDSEEV